MPLVGEIGGSSESTGELFRALLEAAPDAVFVVADDGRIMLVNAQAERLFGYHRDELLGQPVDVLVPEAARDRHPGLRGGYFAGPTTRPMGAGVELAGQRKDGSTFPAEISLSAIRLAGRTFVSAAVRDVTERVELERARREQEAASQQHRTDRMTSLGQLAGGMAHDFNNLLGVILNYSAFVERQIGPESPVQGDVQQIRRAAEQAAALTRQLLAFARREVTRPDVLDLSVTLTDTIRLLRRTLGEDVTLDLRPGLDVWPVLADPAQVEQVLLNLVLNARDAMPDSGALVIDSANVEVQAALTPQVVDVEPGRYVRIRVTDSGVGMDAEARSRAFEPFFTTKEVGRGTGLGLATAYGFVKQAGGDIRIDSQPGRGTTVTVHLPAVEAVPSSSAPPGPLAFGQGEAILVVEDEPASLAMVARILRHFRYQVSTAGDGHAALELLTDVPVDLLLTDVVMPGLGGRELARRAAAIRPGLPVVFMSGNADPATLDGAPLVPKPFTAELLLRSLREVLDR